MNAPITKCPLTDEWCAQSIDCADCVTFKSRDMDVEWVCAFCAVGTRDAWIGTVPDVFVGGVYKAGTCERCRNPRILLIAVERRGQ